MRKRKATYSWTCSCCRQLWKEVGSPSLSSLYLYSPLNEVGVFGVGLDVFLSLFWSLQNHFSPPSQLLKTVQFVSLTFNKTVSLPIQKSTAKTARRCRFRNRQPETVLLPIQKSAAMVESFHLYFFFCLHYWSAYFCKSSPTQWFTLNSTGNVWIPTLLLQTMQGSRAYNLYLQHRNWSQT
jgi:hypothetical protein